MKDKTAKMKKTLAGDCPYKRINKFLTFFIAWALVLLASSDKTWSQSSEDLFLPVGLDEKISPNQVGSGARALGQGNAFIAVADDATAASWNPAGLTQLQKLEISFAIERVYQEFDTDFGSEKTTDFDFTEFNYASMVIPFALWNQKHGVFSLNYLTLFQFEKNLRLPFSNEESGLIERGNYTLDQEGTFSVIAPAFAFELTKSLSLGVTFNIWDDDWTQNSSFKKREQSDGQVIFGPITTDFIFEDVNENVVGKSYSWVLGALYRPSKSWTFAGVLKPSFTLDLEHHRRFTSGDGTEKTVSPFQNSADLDFPWILGAGLAWRPAEPVTVSLDLTWTDWSSYKLDEGESTVNPITGSEEDLQDAYTVRVGSEYNFVFEETLLPLRMGFGYDPSPAVGEVDEYYTVSVGAGLQVGRLMFDVAYEFRWGNNVNGDSLEPFNATQDVQRHRVLSSVILYF